LGRGILKRTMKFREVIRMIEEDGWRFHSQKGSHRQFKHPTKSGRVTVAGQPGHDVHPKTLAAILRQAGIVKE
jgi:predicted RNA binding protein YcfA (HicA-like mRNA interferase family)